MVYKPSSQLKKLIATSKLSSNQVTMAILVAAGLSDADAYYLAGLWQPLLPNANNTMEIERVKKLIYYQNFLTDMRGRMDGIDIFNTSGQKSVVEETEVGSKSVKKVTDEDVMALTKEGQLKMYLSIMNNTKKGSKEWFEASKRIDEIMQFKKEEIQEEEQYTHYYLPLSCKQCALYLNAQKKKSSAGLN